VSDEPSKNEERDDETESSSNEGSTDEPAERDASTVGVARALGVDEDEDDAGTSVASGDDSAGEGDAPAAKNRAARRREEVLKRRAAREGKSDAQESKRSASAESDVEGGASEVSAAVAKPTDEDDELPVRRPLPKDKNARAKELLRRRQEAAEASARAGENLTAGEVVQDQLARAASGTGKWFKENIRAIGAVTAIGLATAAGVLFFLNHQAEDVGNASDELARAVAAERGVVAKEDKRSPEQKGQDPTPVFADVNAKNTTVFAAYEKAVAAKPGSGSSLLAKLGLAGAKLDQGEADAALALFGELLGSELANADVDVRARALEGKGYALEKKGDLAGAMETFKQLETCDPSFENLGRYHQARVHLAKSETDKAKEIFLALEKKLEVPTLEGPVAPHLKSLVDENLRAVDPSRPRPRRALGGPKGAPSMEELERLIEEAQRKREATGEGSHEGEAPGTDAH
jgi:tetratricopeptide (TPR) repeat protein